jgi:hypothetical protein
MAPGQEKWFSALPESQYHETTSEAIGPGRDERQRKARRGRTGDGCRRQGEAKDEKTVYVQGVDVKR